VAPHILLVEDLPNEREMIAAALEQRGAKVTVAASDEEAYAALRGSPARTFQALVTDLNLGEGTTGFDVARAARAMQPGLAVVYITAYDMETRPHAVPDSLTFRKPLR
jgi:CheY-like chemotaxis protein